MEAVHQLGDGLEPHQRLGQLRPDRGEEGGHGLGPGDSEAAADGDCDQEQERGHHRELTNAADGADPAQPQEEQEDNDHGQGDELRVLQADQ